MVDVTLAYLLPKVVNVIHDEQIVVETYDLGKVMEELVREEFDEEPRMALFRVRVNPREDLQRPLRGVHVPQPQLVRRGAREHA